MSSSAAPTDHGYGLPPRWPALVRWFTWYARRFVRRNFHAVRVLRGTAPPAFEGRPILVAMNHPSWWDPMLALVAATEYYPRRRHFAPIDAAMLQKYRLFARLGFFGVEPDTRRGAASFLRTGFAIAAERDTALWVTAQGMFTDPRARPVALRPGLTRLALRADRAVVLPMTIEYAFWGERFPEALLAFGTPLDPAEHRHLAPEAWNAVVEAELQSTMDRLAAASIARDAQAFDVVLSGSVGVGGPYDALRRGAAWLGGRRFNAQHLDAPALDRRTA